MRPYNRVVELCILIFVFAFIFFLDQSTLNFMLFLVAHAVAPLVLFYSIFMVYARVYERILSGTLVVALLAFQTYLVASGHFSIQDRADSGVVLIMAVMLEFYILRRKKKRYMFKPIDENSLSFEDLREFNQPLRPISVEKMGEVLTVATLREMMKELPRNCAVRYVNKGSLSETYLENLDNSMSDPYIYLVLSDTGSAASNMIGMITSKTYNHISISFDNQLKTLVSYNGGEKLTPPGLNAEMLEWFFKKEDASIRIYRMKVTRQQKIDMAEQVKQINQEGSAYNLLGMAMRHSFEPNIMVCSHFVYGLLCSVGAQYFVKSAAEVRPTDLIELDYNRKLEYIETLTVATMAKPSTYKVGTSEG